MKLGEIFLFVDSTMCIYIYLDETYLEPLLLHQIYGKQKTCQIHYS